VPIFVAASTKVAVEQIAADFNKETGIGVEVVPGPSSGLVKQIEQGAKAELFLSADQASADRLAEKGLIDERRNLLTNTLVVIVPADSSLEIKDLNALADASVKRLAVAEPKVPAGEYARDALTKAGILDKVQDKFVGGIDVKATLQFVARGEADAGFVYLTDAIGNSQVKVAFQVPADLHRPIEYPLVLLKQGTADAGAKRLYEYLGSEKAAKVFEGARFGLAR
jgi:molybdate transport system substrate-binding protein